MCDFASFIITREKTYWLPDSDSHEEILRQHKIKDNSKEIVRVELIPPDCNPRRPVEEWEFSTNQKDLPEWYSEKWARQECERKLQALLKIRIITQDRGAVIGGLHFVFQGAPTITTMSGGMIRACDTSAPTITTMSGGEIVAYDTSAPTITTMSGGVIRACDTSAPTITTMSGGMIRACDTSAPTITTVSGGMIRACDTSAPTITTMSGGVIRTYDTSAPTITTMSGGVIMAYGTSALVVKNDKRAK